MFLIVVFISFIFENVLSHVVEDTDGDDGSSAGARVPINVGERTDDDDGPSANARVSIKIGERTDGDAESAASASEDAISSVSVDVIERFNCSSDIFCFFVADDEKKRCNCVLF